MGNGIQATYDRYHNARYAGQIYSIEPYATVSKLNKGTATIPFGMGVISDGADGAALPVATFTTQQFIGVVERELNRAYYVPMVAGGTADVFGAVPGYDMTVLTMGRIGALAAVTVAKDDPVFLIYGATGRGTWSNVIGTGATAAIQIPNAKWVVPAAAGAIGEIAITIGG